ncbi:sugar phosphate isomerase/epimerase [Paenibacillus sp. UNC499MF]|uniref:sugar phosphate isomerase/epimerase family protein n=1 Tax=Paenibacillus sp. UNC499MF TaxID=1502751 RepID=UPI0008A00A2C|nr:sugar phosphate isomerase/epimerase [Paenibacillus sp. UNC499MF]SEG56395.1 Sugar phosphate isomerase/epimerase [Paenibacillus sp. UNC499MF]
MKIAAFSGALMEYSIQEAMKITADLGFDGIEIACREPHLSPQTSIPRVKEIRRLADEHVLDIPVLGGYMGRFSESGDSECAAAYDEFLALLERADYLETDMIRVFPGGPNAFLAADYHYEKAAHWLRKCAEEARRYEKTILLEIHNVSLIETVESSLRLLEMIGEDNVGLIHDAGNMYISDTDFGRASVTGLGSRLQHVHVKDEKRIPAAGGPGTGTFRNVTRHGEEHFLQCRLGEGEVDHRELFEALAETGYGGWVTLECFAPYPPIEQLAHDRDAVRQLLREAAASAAVRTTTSVPRKPVAASAATAPASTAAPASAAVPASEAQASPDASASPASSSVSAPGGN